MTAATSASSWRVRVGLVVAGLALSCAGGDAPAPPLAPPPDARVCLPGDGDQPGELPARLSETGCFTDLRRLVPAPGVVAYDVISPLWSDGSGKERFFVLPPGEAMGLLPDGSLTLPVGTVLIKSFAFDLVVDGRGNARPVETRFMVLRPGAWELATYRWNAAGDDAEQLSVDGLMEELEVFDAAGEPATLSWFYPSEDTCRACHSGAEGSVIGFRAAQLDRDFRYDTGRVSQLEAWAELGLLTGLEDARPLARLPDPMDRAAFPSARARSYLDGNCAHCHRPGGWAPSTLGMDLRYDTPLSDTGLCRPTAFLDSSSHRVVAGAPEDSAVFRRMTSTGLDRMPPAGTRWVDARGVAVVRDWIESLTTCPSTGP